MNENFMHRVVVHVGDSIQVFEPDDASTTALLVAPELFQPPMSPRKRQVPLEIPHKWYNLGELPYEEELIAGTRDEPVYQVYPRHPLDIDGQRRDAVAGS